MQRSYGPRSSGAFHGPVPKLSRHAVSSRQLAFGGERRDLAVRRLDDQRGEPGRLAQPAFTPVGGAAARIAGRRGSHRSARLDSTLDPFLVGSELAFASAEFIVGQLGPAGELLRPFERRAGDVGAWPQALDIRIAPGSPRMSPDLRRLRRRRFSRRSLGGQRHRGEHNRREGHRMKCRRHSDSSPALNYHKEHRRQRKTLEAEWGWRLGGNWKAEWQKANGIIPNF